MPPQRMEATIPIAAVFPKESMRSESAETVHSIELALPLLEKFMGTPFPSNTVEIWYGFEIGLMGGTGELDIEDRSSFEARMPSGSPPYESGVVHELSHSYIHHESLNDYLQLYAYNMIHTGSVDVGSWIYTENYVPGLTSNTGESPLCLTSTNLSD